MIWNMSTMNIYYILFSEFSVGMSTVRLVDHPSDLSDQADFVTTGFCPSF